MPSKKPSKLQAPLPRRAAEGLDEADDLLQQGQVDEARTVLEELADHYPNRPEVLAELVNVCIMQDDNWGIIKTGERLLQTDYTEPELWDALAGAYLQNTFVVLTWRTLQLILRRAPDYHRIKKVGETLTGLERAFEGLLAEMRVYGEPSLQLLELHERVQVALGTERYVEARRLAHDLLKTLPTFTPALNNLAQAHFAEGQLLEAVTVEERVLTTEPDNIHALSNLTRYFCLLGRLDEARAMSERLLASSAPAAQRAHKVMEALAALGDDARILELFQRLQDAAEAEEPFLWHAAAAAHLRQGREAEAKRHWNQALKLAPDYPVAQDNLADLRRPAGERNGPWSFQLGNWLPRQTISDLLRLMNQTKNKGEGGVHNAVMKFLRQHPEMPGLIDILLDRGDPPSREFVIMFVGMAQTPEFLAQLKDYALSQHGTDQSRMKAAQLAAQAGLLPNGRTRMWMRGEWSEILLMGWEIHGEPVRGVKHQPQVERWLRTAIEAIHAGDYRQAEKLLKQGLALEPNTPDLNNNLASVYTATGRRAEAEVIVREIYKQHPDYLFARANLARMLAQQGEVAQAKELLDPLFQRTRLHFSEFASLAIAQIEISLAENNREAARSWFEMWEGIDADHPNLEVFRARVGKARSLQIPDWLKRLPGGRA